MHRILPMPDHSLLQALKTRKKSTDHLIVLMKTLDKIDPKLQMEEIQRIVVNIDKLIETYKESTQIIANTAFINDAQLATIKLQEDQWQEFLKIMKNFNLKFQNKYIEWQKLNQKFKNQDMIKKSYPN